MLLVMSVRLIEVSDDLRHGGASEIGTERGVTLRLITQGLCEGLDVLHKSHCQDLMRLIRHVRHISLQYVVIQLLLGFLTGLGGCPLVRIPVLSFGLCERSHPAEHYQRDDRKAHSVSILFHYCLPDERANKAAARMR